MNKKNKQQYKDSKLKSSKKLPIDLSSSQVPTTVFLYGFVFKSIFSVLISFTLLLSLLMQGVYDVYAADEALVEEEVTQSPDSENFVVDEILEEETETEGSGESNESGEEVLMEEELPETNQTEEELLAEEVVDLESETTDLDSSVKELSLDDDDDDDDDLLISETKDQSGVDGEIATTTSAIEDNDSEATITEGNLPEEEAETADQSSTQNASETTIDELPDRREALTALVSSDKVVSFSRDKCTELASGSFYCFEPKVNQLADALFAAPDADGDLEIFLVRGGEQRQITQNQVDDAAPYFDAKSNTIVWHRLLSDRYQIISFDLNTGLETQLTDNLVNNVEPNRQGNYTVWQRWTNSSWNIVLFDGVVEKMITDDINNNVAPSIQGNLVIWNKYNQNNHRTIEVFNLDNNAYLTVADADGLSAKNPRMVLMYDSVYENGDVVTKGFDIFTGEIIDLTNKSKTLPEIPETEADKESKALIQRSDKKGISEGDVLDDDLSGIGGGPDPEPLLASTKVSTSTDLTLDLSVSSSTTDSATEIVDLVVGELNDQTIELSNQENSVTTDISAAKGADDGVENYISDLVIPELNLDNASEIGETTIDN